MNNTKYFMRPGEKARLEIEPLVAIDESTIEWKSGGGIVAIDQSEQKTPYDARVIATGQSGITYVEFSAKQAVSGEDVLVVFEIHNNAAQNNPKARAFARLSRSYRRDSELAKQPTGFKQWIGADSGSKKSDGETVSLEEGKEFPKAEFNETGTGFKYTHEVPSEEQKEASGLQKAAASRENDQSQTMRMNADNPTQSAGLPEKAPENSSVIGPSPVNDTTTTSLGGTIGNPAFASGAKPTTTVLGIDTITPEQNGELDAAGTHADEPEESRRKTEEAVEEVRQIDESLQKEADKLPSETELSGTPNDVIIPPVNTVTEDDARREANKTDDAPTQTDAEETETENPPAETEAPTEEAPKNNTDEKPAKPAKKSAKKETKKDK